MNDLEQKLHRTWVQAFVEFGYPEIAAIALDIDIEIEWEEVSSWEQEPKAVWFDIPMPSFKFAKENEAIIKRIFLGIANGNIGDVENFPIQFRVALLEIEEGWKDIVKRLILNARDPNQGIITEKLFLNRGEQPYIYNEMKFASKTEIRIAQELEARQILFFPLPLAVRCETGKNYVDHKEVDFLICENGTWGILEVSYHENRYEKDKEKDAWFKRSGILCVEHYTAERCFNRPKSVVDEFLEILRKYK
jgi:hypothetical protein